MKRFNNQKKKLSMTIALVLIVFIGLAYAFLNEKLIINNILSYNSMNFEVGFIDITDGGGTIKSTGTVSNDGKTIDVSCNIGDSKTQESCIVKATIINNSSFNIGLSKEPIITYDDKYIHTLTVKWKNHPTFLNSTVHQNGFIESGEREEIVITVKTKFLNNNNLPGSGTQIPIKIEFDFIEYPEATLPETKDLAILASSGCSVDMAAEMPLVCGGTFAGIPFNIMNFTRNIYFEDNINVPADIVGTWDLSQNQNGKVMAYAVPNTENIDENNTYYDLYIQSNGQLYANEDMTAWFAHCYFLNSINGLSLMDTSMTTNMSGMFGNVYFYHYETNPLYTLSNIDLSNFDTSNVTNMMGMFLYSGYTNPDFTLDVSGFDTSNVTAMASTFEFTAYNNKEFTLDVTNFNTSKIENMSYMFSYAGYNSTVFTLDVSNFDTSNVEDMNSMFYRTGYYSTIFQIDVSNFDTNNVTNMRAMFSNTGFNNPNFTLDVSGFDTSQVTDMAYMFYSTGHSNSTFTLDVSNFDTSKVTDMCDMFGETGYNSTIFTLDVSGFDTSNVTDMKYMFVYTGYSNPTFTLDVSGFDTSKVTDMSRMFYQTGYNSTIFTLDVSNFDTSNVKDMSYMFYNTGYNSTIFTLDVSDFDMSNVTDMSRMFSYAGYNSTLLNTSITIRNPNVSYSSMFWDVATKEGTQITVNYTSDTESIIDNIIDTKSTDANVVRGSLVN